MVDGEARRAGFHLAGQPLDHLLDLAEPLAQIGVLARELAILTLQPGQLRILRPQAADLVGLGLLLRERDDHLDAYQLAKVAMIIEVLTARFQVLLDTAIDGMLALRRREAQTCTRTPHTAEGAEA